MNRPSPYHLIYAASLFAAAVAVSAAYGVLGWVLRAAPDQFTTGGDDA
jgi:hypothetical protein